MNIPVIVLFDEYNDLKYCVQVDLLDNPFIFFKEKAKEFEVKMKTKIIDETECQIDFKNQYRLVYYPKISSS